MQVISTVSGLRAALAPHRRAGKSVGLVPTMGYLHDGHMRLVERARAENDVVVTSLFVNPLQFGANEDLAKYPRDLGRDSAMLEAGKVDFLFAPTVEDRSKPSSMSPPSAASSRAKYAPAISPASPP